MRALDTLLARIERLERDVAIEMEGAPQRTRRARARARSDTREADASKSILGGIERELGKRVRGVLRRLEVPTRSDIENLTSRIIDLEQGVLKQLRAGRERLGTSRRSSKRRSNRR